MQFFMRKFYKMAGFCLLIASCVYFYMRLSKVIPDLYVFFDQHSLFDYIVLVNIYTLSIVIGGIVWFLLMCSYKAHDKNLLLYLHIYLFSQIAKYLPGNVGHHLGRLYLVKKYHYPLPQVIATMVVENILPIISSLLLFGFVLYQHADVLSHYLHQYILDDWSAIISSVMLCFLLCILFVRKKICQLASKYIDSRIRYLNVFLAFVLNFGCFLILGYILNSLIGIYQSDQDVDFFLITGIFAICWLLGFVTPGSPAGIGVREALLIALLSPLYGDSMAVWLSVMLRIITTLGDGVAFLIGVVLTPIVKRSMTS